MCERVRLFLAGLVMGCVGVGCQGEESQDDCDGANMHLVDGDCVPLEDDTAADTSGPFPCGENSRISIGERNIGYANPGTVFSSSADLPEGHTPKPIWLTVMEEGEPVSGCEVRFDISEGNGWVFSRPKTTDEEGKIKAYWTAGALVGTQQATASITLRDGSVHSVTWEGTVTDTRSRTDSVYLNYDLPGLYDGFRVGITPLSGPLSTYYATIVWPGAYGGIQFDDEFSLVIFSTWDTDEGDAEVLDSGACNLVPDFGGEGTGVSCRLVFPPSEYGSIPGLPDDYHLAVGHEYETLLEIEDCGSDCQDYTFTFTDLTRGLGPISLGTQRYRSSQLANYASSFLEEWAENGNCTQTQRSALFHDVAMRSNGAWADINTAVFSPLYSPSNNEICANYFAEGSEEGFKVVTGGTGPVTWPSIAGDDDYPSTRTVAIP